MSPLPRSLAVALAFAISALFASASVHGPRGLAVHSDSAGTRATLDVRQALEEQAAVRVLITLREPPALRASDIDVPALRSQVASAQDKLLSGIGAPELRLNRRYSAVPAIAASVTAQGLAALEARPDVVEVALDGEGTFAMIDSGPLTHAYEVFDAGVTGAGITVAVLDTGIDTDHVDLVDSIAYERCFLTLGSCPPQPHPAEDDHGHGTNVSGIITSNGTVAPRGVAPGSMIASYKVLNSGGSGLFSDWLAALDDIIDDHPEVDLINMSLQSSVSCPNAAIDEALATLRAQGVGVFIAAGNHGTKNSFTIPSCFEDGISVGAVYDKNVGSVSGWKTACTDSTTSADDVACWSDSAPSLDLLAPGAYVTSTGRNGASSTYLGTSQAAPHAAGVAALLMESMPGLTLDEVEAWLKATGKQVTDDLNDSDPDTKRQTPRIDARVALLTDGDADFDGDGCTNAQELGPQEQFGGHRNPLWPWDYMNPTHDGMNRVDDVLFVLGQYFIDEGEPGYTTDSDRTPLGPYPWSLGAPDGLQRIDDVLAQIAQYFHDCAV